MGLVYLHYVDLSIPYAISRAPYMMRSVLGITAKEDIALKQIIIQQHPELEAADITDYEKVGILRDWAAKVVDSSSISLQLNLRDQSFSSWSAYDIYSAFVGDQGGVVCGGTARFLMKVYQVFGFEAGTLNFGIVNLHTHMVSLVQIEHGGQELWSVQDAWNNLTYEGLNVEPMDYYKMLRLLKQQKDDEIVIVEPKTPLVRDWLYYDGDPFWPTLKEGTYVGPVQQVGQETSNIIKYRYVFPLVPLSDEGKEFFTKKGLPPKAIYLYMFPKGIGYCPGAEELLEEASQITGWPLPVVPLSVK